MCNILLVLFLFFLFSGDVQADAISGVSLSSARDGAHTAEKNDVNGTVADRVSENAKASVPAVSGKTDAPHDLQEDFVYQFDPVSVVAEKPQAGKATIGGAELQSLPSRTGSITEAIKGFSNVQFSNEDTSSLTGGEIRPPRVSIAGAKPYENNFLIDGMSVTNTLNPSGLDADGDSIVPNDLHVNGGDQTIFYDSSLVNTVTVYTSNVPAKYGGFMGGVVGAELVDPRTDRWHAVFSGGHSRSEWFDLRGVDEDSTTSANQPRFRTYALRAGADGPLSENAALLVAASQRRSIIPLKMEAPEDSFYDKSQKRSSENLFTKLLFTPDDDLKLTLDATYAPYKEERWKPLYENSDWKTQNEAFRLAGSATLDGTWGKLGGRVAYSRNGYSRDSMNNLRETFAGTGVPEEEWYYRGGIGDAKVVNRGIDAGLDVDLSRFETGDVSWGLSSGLALSNVTTDMWNEEARMEILTLPSSGKWTQVFTTYPESDQRRTLNTLGWYGQAEIEWGRFILTPGLRVDYDDFSHNTDVATRLKMELDTMGDGALRVVAGVNRYYGGQLRAYAFDRYRPSSSLLIRYNTDPDNLPPAKESDDQSYTAKGLDTPYSDELMGGLLGDLAGFEYSLEFVHRDHRKQIISKAREEDVYELTNDGKSTYDGISLTLARSFETKRFGSHSLSLGVSQSRTKTFNGAFDSEIDEYKEYSGYEYDYDRVFYEDELMDRSSLPPDDYNAPAVVTLRWMGLFFEDRFRVNCVSRWRDSTTGLKNDTRTFDETPYGTAEKKKTAPSSKWLDEDGLYHDAYKTGIISGSLVTDISLELDVVKEELFTMSLMLDVFNVFAADGHVGVSQIGSEDVPAPRSEYGRGYYAGIRCEF
ncbi:MAG: TonB-dependent receptor plug domain-containing protein [Desulfomicrobium sp.]|nr:TonB-dependent receptor plug domain-containing protein [Desulfomicrobium sp.]